MDPEREVGGRRMLAGLLAASHLTPIDRLPLVVADRAQAAGFTQVLIYLGDLQRRVLRLLAGVAGSQGDERELQIDGTTPGRAYQYGHILPAGSTESSGTSRWEDLDVATAPAVYHQATETIAQFPLVILALSGVTGRSCSRARGAEALQ